MGTPVVALDEPTAGLDARGRDRARSIVTGLREEGRTVILAGHDRRFLGAVADRIVALEQGRVAHDDPWSEPWSEPSSPSSGT
jgi:energy-coupling factor transporter ATP-binding protein EcfA2